MGSFGGGLHTEFVLECKVATRDGLQSFLHGLYLTVHLFVFFAQHRHGEAIIEMLSLFVRHISLGCF